MRRREFVFLVGGFVVARPLTTIAQQPEHMRRIGVLMNRSVDSPEGQAYFAAFAKSLQQSAWSDGGNVHIDVRWGANDLELERKYATELVALAPEVIVAAGTEGVTAVQRATRTVPIVFASVSDPVGAGFVDNLSRPGGNTTGFMLFEYSLSGKWLEILKQIVPGLTRAAVLRDAANPAGIAQFGAIRTSATSLGIDVSPIAVRDTAENEHGIVPVMVG
jgi:putative ABC transport system substrate-binding protein